MNDILMLEGFDHFRPKDRFWKGRDWGGKQHGNF
jgi:hypothetical protein